MHLNKQEFICLTEKIQNKERNTVKAKPNLSRRREKDIKERNTDRQKDRQRECQIERKTDRENVRQREKQKERKSDGEKVRQRERQIERNADREKDKKERKRQERVRQNQRKEHRCTQGGVREEGGGYETAPPQANFRKTC